MRSQIHIGSNTLTGAGHNVGLLDVAIERMRERAKEKETQKEADRKREGQKERTKVKLVQ